MAKPEWGEKHRCSSCGKPFYDMKKKPIICPACGAENVAERLLKPRRHAGSAAVAAAEKKAAALALAAKKKAAEEEDEDLDDDLVDPDTVDLGDDDDDDDDLSGVVIKPKSDSES
ncbi:TIGR02300 family protein [Sneathiella sp.]|uniref:TIGR02300 family protein n=1 Tax=Sneathiella sp. TaxID=1964365 RepID=UPI00356617D4